MGPKQIVKAIGDSSERRLIHKMGLDGIYRKTVPLNVHLIESNAGHKGVTAGDATAEFFPQFETDNTTPTTEKCKPPVGTLTNQPSALVR